MMRQGQKKNGSANLSALAPVISEDATTAYFLPLFCWGLEAGFFASFFWPAFLSAIALLLICFH